MADVPQLLPALPVGEWNYINTITAPPATGQVRLDNATQTAATHLWFDKTNAMNADASAALMATKTGSEISLANKTDPTKLQVYGLTASPVDKGSYVDYPVVWKRSGSGGAFPAQRTTMEVITTNVVIPVSGFRLLIETHPVELSGQLMTFDFAYPFQGKNYTSPGMTIRQYYAAQAMLGFIAGSNVPASNLVGKVAAFAFTAADSMIEFEEKERLGYHMPPAGSDRNAPITPSATTPPPPEDTSILKPPLSPTMKQVWPRKIIS